MRSFLLAAVAALTVLSANQAKAAILLEPYLGYEIGTYAPGAAGSSNSDLSGVVLGARLAYEFPVLFVGLDYDTLISGTWKQNGNSNNLSGQNLFAEVGVQVPLLRAYAGYAISHDLTFKGTPDTKMDGGTDFKLGVGTTILPLLAINLEYLNSTYDKANGNSFGNTDKSSIYRLAVSVPFTF